MKKEAPFHFDLFDDDVGTGSFFLSALLFYFFFLFSFFPLLIFILIQMIYWELLIFLIQQLFLLIFLLLLIWYSPHSLFSFLKLSSLPSLLLFFNIKNRQCILMQKKKEDFFMSWNGNHLAWRFNFLSLWKFSLPFLSSVSPSQTFLFF